MYSLNQSGRESTRDISSRLGWLDITHEFMG
jgi:hypothetical protein